MHIPKVTDLNLVLKYLDVCGMYWTSVVQNSPGNFEQSRKNPMLLTFPLSWLRNMEVYSKLKLSINTKLRQLGVSYQIVNDSDSKPSKFDRLYRSDSKSDNQIVSSIPILIKFRSHFH